MPRVHSRSTWAIRYWMGKKTWGLLRSGSLHDDIYTFRTQAEALWYIRSEDMQGQWEAVELIPRKL